MKKYFIFILIFILNITNSISKPKDTLINTKDFQTYKILNDKLVQDSLKNIRSNVEDCFRKEAKDNFNTFLIVFGFGIAILIALVSIPIFQYRKLKKKIIKEEENLKNEIKKQKKELEKDLLNQYSELEKIINRLRKKVEPLVVQAEELQKSIDIKQLDLKNIENLSEETRNKLKAINNNIELREQIGEKLTSDDYFYRAYDYYQLKEYDKVIIELEKSLELNPKNYRAWSNMGIALNKIGKHQKAIDCYDQSISINSNSFNSWYNKGNTLLNLKFYEEALKCYERAIEIKSEDNQVWNNKGNTLLGLSRIIEAIDCYDISIKINPIDFHSWNNKGIALYKLKKYKEAIECYDKSIYINPDFNDSWYNKACAYSLLKNKKEMIIALKRAIELDINNNDKAKNDPDFKEYLDDSDFGGLTS